MTIQAHDLLHELPEHKERIHELKTHNRHFAKLFEEYHTVNREIHRVEEELETPSDEYTETLKKKRLSLKDELFAIIKNAAA